MPPKRGTPSSTTSRTPPRSSAPPSSIASARLDGGPHQVAPAHQEFLHRLAERIGLRVAGLKRQVAHDAARDVLPRGQHVEVEQLLEVADDLLAAMLAAVEVA